MRPLGTNGERRTYLDQLRVEVAAHLPILPELSAQLRASTQFIEDSVLQVCTNFQNMTNRVLESVARSSQLLASSQEDGGQERQSIEGLVEAAGGTLETLLERVVEGAALSEQVASRMETVDQGMKQLSATLKDVHEVVRATKVLGVNARIEAVRVGERAQGFALVATEISAFSKRFARIAVSIEDVVEKVDRDVSSTTVVLRERAAADRSQMEVSRAQIEELLQGFRKTNEATRQFLKDSASQSQELSGEICDAMVALQFQDRISQRIGNVVAALDSMHAALTEPLEALGESGLEDTEARRQEVTASLRNRYTTAAERAVAQQGVAWSLDAPVQPDDIELF